MLTMVCGSVNLQKYFLVGVKSYSHTVFFGKILLRVIGRKLLWFDDEAGEWRDCEWRNVLV